MVEGGLPGQTGAIFHFRPKGRFPGGGRGLRSIGVNSPESTYQIILKPDAFPMDRGWYRLHRGATGHGSDATACTPGRVVRL